MSKVHLAYCVCAIIFCVKSSSSSCCCFSLCVEINSSNRGSQSIFSRKLPSVELIPCCWCFHCLPSSLFVQQKYITVDPNDRFRCLVAHYLPSCNANENFKVKLKTFINLHDCTRIRLTKRGVSGTGNVCHNPDIISS